MAPKKKASEASPAASTPVLEEATGVLSSVTPATTAAAAEETVKNAVEETPIPVSGTPTEVYSQLQTILSSNHAKVNQYIPQVLELVQAAESSETSILLRVRFLEFVGQYVSAVRDNNALKKIVTSLVKVVGGDDNTPQLLTAALHAFAGLGPVSQVEKNWEYLAREGADVLMQVMIDHDAFPEQVRQAALKSLDSLSSSAFRSVLAKLLHWMSIDREEDSEEQLSMERRMALSRLNRLVMAPSMRHHWTEETQQYAIPLIQRVMSSLDAREFSQLTRVAAHLPLNRDHGGIPMLEAYLAHNQLNDDRHMESAAILGRYVTGTQEFDMTPALEACGMLKKELNVADDHSVYAARVLLLACRVATPEAAEKLYPYVMAQVKALLSNMKHTCATANLGTVEAVLFCAIVIARKKSAEMLQTLNDAAFNEIAVVAAAVAAEVDAQVTFAVKKLVQSHESAPENADAVATVHNIKLITEAFAAKRLPLGEIKESWIGQNAQPAVKRGRAPEKAAMPPPPGSRADQQRKGNNNASQHKRSRVDHSNNNHNNNGAKRHRGGRR